MSREENADLRKKLSGIGYVITKEDDHENSWTASLAITRRLGWPAGNPQQCQIEIRSKSDTSTPVIVLSGTVVGRDVAFEIRPKSCEDCFINQSVYIATLFSAWSAAVIASQLEGSIQ